MDERTEPKRRKTLISRKTQTLRPPVHVQPCVSDRKTRKFSATQGWGLDGATAGGVLAGGLMITRRRWAAQAAQPRAGSLSSAPTIKYVTTLGG